MIQHLGSDYIVINIVNILPAIGCRRKFRKMAKADSANKNESKNERFIVDYVLIGRDNRSYV